MDYNISFRNKDKGIQAIISYKDYNGKWKQKSKQGFKTQKESKPWIRAAIEKLEEEMDMASKLDNEFKNMTFLEFKEFYLKDLELHKEVNTINNYRLALDRFGRLDNMYMSDITFLEIKNIVNDMLKEGLKVTSIRSYITRLNTALITATVEYKIISENPLSNNKIKLPAIKENKKIKALTKTELDSLLSEVKPYKDYIITLIASSCGLRAGEIVGLTWSDVDFKNANLHINKQWKEKKDGTYGFGALKTRNSNRIVPIPPSCLKELKIYKAECVKDILHDRLFMDQRPINLSTRLNLKYKRLGFNISIHDLRHTYATLLIANGVDFKTVAEFMGDTVDMIIKTYVHFNKEMFEAGRSKLESIF